MVCTQCAQANSASEMYSRLQICKVMLSCMIAAESYSRFRTLNALEIKSLHKVTFCNTQKPFSFNQICIHTLILDFIFHFNKPQHKLRRLCRDSLPACPLCPHMTISATLQLTAVNSMNDHHILKLCHKCHTWPTLAFSQTKVS